MKNFFYLLNFHMIATKYKYALVDMSYILMRNMFVVSKGKKKGEFTAGDVIKITIQTINKIPRDYGITADKFIFIYDKWDKELGGYYRTYLLKGLYKTTREYMTPELVEQMRQDPNVTPKQLEEAEQKAYFNQIKYEAKWGMVRDLKNIGLPCVGVEGWEFDDVAYLAACMLYGEGNKPSVIITKDSDLTYSLTPQMDYFKLPTGGSEPKTITYSEMFETIPDILKDKISLYQYKSFLDSLGEGHNDMTKTRKNNIDITGAILKILQGDFSDLENYEVFMKQMQSFDISKFPRLDEAQELIATQFDKIGKLGSIDDFHGFCQKYKVEGISDKYFTEFINRFNPKLFSE